MVGPGRNHGFLSGEAEAGHAGRRPDVVHVRRRGHASADRPGGAEHVRDSISVSAETRRASWSGSAVADVGATSRPRSATVSGRDELAARYPEFLMWTRHSRGPTELSAIVEPDCDGDGFGDGHWIRTCRRRSSPKGAVTAIFDASKNKVRKGKRVTLSGRLTTAARQGPCETSSDRRATAKDAEPDELRDLRAGPDRRPRQLLAQAEAQEDVRVPRSGGRDRHLHRRAIEHREGQGKEEEEVRPARHGHGRCARSENAGLISTDAPRTRFQADDDHAGKMRATSATQERSRVGLRVAPTR